MTRSLPINHTGKEANNKQQKSFFAIFHTLLDLIITPKIIIHNNLNTKKTTIYITFDATNIFKKSQLYNQLTFFNNSTTKKLMACNKSEARTVFHNMLILPWLSIEYISHIYHIYIIYISHIYSMNIQLIDNHPVSDRQGAGVPRRHKQRVRLLLISGNKALTTDLG